MKLSKQNTLSEQSPCEQNAARERSIARRRRDERGSVLIFVIGVLVLLALSATAFLSTARTDRVATKQNESNTQIDLLLESMVQAAIAKVVDDAAVSTKQSEFTNITSSAVNRWIASRVPMVFNDNGGFTPSLTVDVNPGVWTSLTSPIFGTSFESPTGQVVPLTAPGSVHFAPRASNYNGRITPVFSYDLLPNNVTFDAAINGDLSLSPGNASNPLLFAGDADGDGIADALPVRVPVGKLNGLDYFAYFRIIDNGSAINVNTAMSRDADFAYNATDSGFDNVATRIFGFFTANVGLVELLRDTPARSAIPPLRAPLDLGLNFNSYLEYHFNATFAAEIPSGIAKNMSAQSSWPMEDDKTLRMDFVWISFGDIIDHQITSRTENPGSTTPAKEGRAFDSASAAALASRFVLTDASSGPSDVELNLRTSIYFTDATATSKLKSNPYQVDEAQNLWFSNLFDYATEDPEAPGAWKQRRPLFTALANVRNLVPTQYPVGNFTSSSTNVPVYVPPFPAQTPAASPPVLADPASPGALIPAGMAEFPKGGAPKVSINTAPFSELFRAYWQVFAESDFTGAGDGAGSFLTSAPPLLSAATLNAYVLGATFDPYLGMKVQPDPRTYVPDATQPFNPARMFRSPIRCSPDDPDPGSHAPTEPAGKGNMAAQAIYPATVAYSEGYRMTVDQVMLLRAAIAAVNTEALRAQNDINVSIPGVASEFMSTPDTAIYRDIPLSAHRGTGGAAVPVVARVFGVQRQPYITEVFAQNDTITPGQVGMITLAGANPKGYVAIELYNPYDVAIDISDCKIATLHRLRHTAPAGTLPDMRLVDTSDGSIAEIGLEPINLATATSNMDTPLTGGTLIVPAKGYLVLENYDANTAVTPTKAVYRPESATMLTASGDGQGKVLSSGTPSNNVAFVENLHQVFNREFVLMRPLSAEISRDPAGDPSTSGQVLKYVLPATPVGNIRYDYVPLDSFDLSGLPLYDLNLDTEYMLSSWPHLGNIATNWHYQRDTEGWRFVYPGRYDAQSSDRDDYVVPPSPRTMGTRFTDQQWNPTATQTDTWDPQTMSPPPDTVLPIVTLGRPNPVTRQNTQFAIQLVAKNWPGINAIGPRNAYPFGKFGRLGDLLQVPFIGSYIITDPNVTAMDAVVEVNPITIDAAMAEDTDIENDPISGDSADASREQIGRFTPLRSMEVGGVRQDDPEAPGVVYSDYSTDPDKWRYRFARKLFDYFTLTSPADDYLPNVKYNQAMASQNLYRYTDSTGAVAPPTPSDMAPGSVAGLPRPRPVANTLLPTNPGPNDHTDYTNALTGELRTANDSAENTEPVRGMININTAPWKVLAMIPWMPGTPDMLSYNVATGVLTGTPNAINDNEELARALVYWRDGNVGARPAKPMQSLFDLYRAPAFIEAQSTILNTAEPDDIEGDLSPFGTSNADGVRYDFEEQYLLLNRVSNLITTRSDTFTIYVLLQGWRNAGTANPELVTERRAALILDRSQYDASNGKLGYIRVPTN